MVLFESNIPLWVALVWIFPDLTVIFCFTPGSSSEGFAFNHHVRWKSLSDCFHMVEFAKFEFNLCTEGALTLLSHPAIDSHVIKVATAIGGYAIRHMPDALCLWQQHNIFTARLAWTVADKMLYSIYLTAIGNLRLLLCPSHFYSIEHCILNTAWLSLWLFLGNKHCPLINLFIRYCNFSLLGVRALQDDKLKFNIALSNFVMKIRLASFKYSLCKSF